MIIETNLDLNAARHPIVEAEPLKVKIRRGIITKDVHESLDVKDDWVPGENERPYFFPGCTVPRFKVRESFNITIKPEYATAAFISPETLKESEDGFETLTRMYQYPLSEILSWIKTAYGKDHAFTVKVQSLSLNCENTILIHNDCVDKLRSAALLIKSNPDFNNLSTEDRKIMTYTENFYTDRTTLNIPTMDSILNRLNCDIYDQKCMLKLVNKDCITVDEGRYKELCVMAEASDKDNLSTVMELIANCDFDKSCIYLLCLLHKYGKEMAPMKGASHVNFKSLLHYFGLTIKDIKVPSKRASKVDSMLTLDKLIASLEDLGKLTSKNFQRLVSLFPLTEEAELKQAYKYVIPSFALKEEYLDQLDDEEIIEDADDIDIDENVDTEFIN